MSRSVAPAASRPVSPPRTASPPPSPLPATLRRNAPLVPTDSSASRALAAVIAILTFLAALCAGAAEIVASSADQWQGAVAQEVTIQVRPSPGRDLDADVARAESLAKATPGIAAARVFSKAEAERLLEPWLGSGLDLSDLPVPRLVTLRLAESARPDLKPLRASLAEALPGVASLDDHALWLRRLSTMANTFVGVGVGLVALVLVATGLAVVFATRGAMAGNREVVEVLHFVGADDDFIARAFQRRFFRLGLRGGIIGSVAALIAFAIAGFAAGAWRSGPAGEEIEALFGAFHIGWRGYASVLLIGVIASVVTGIVSRLTVRRFLA
ncbi:MULTISPECIES: cell division protein FtsX [unclassified Methylobacterium]|jgi:cell division transport system permease protein|uniref:cell division protein FtsX n=1 Tax=unclassified Methylobacterium TaxID=2615210 RepID=UPI0006FE421B|nr:MULTISPECIES: ABC transporter permease [unclassified Methylobacterium]KQO55868.1 cell division protein FtsX [Methylobacterium sp. Leaf87]KQP58392.1 cell division protein FtsX [Methylobacterium sp. Leaf112]